MKSTSLEYARNWRKNNKDKIKLYSKREYLKYKPKLLARTRKWREQNKERVKNYNKIYKIEHREILKQKGKKYLFENKETITKKASARYIKKYRTDKVFALQCNLRKRLGDAFRKFSSNGKLRSADKYGIDYNAIINHLGPCPGERKDYDIDHIRPLNQFNFDNIEEVKQAFTPGNHRWLSVSINRKEQRRQLS